MNEIHFSPAEIVINNKETHPHLDCYFKGLPLKAIGSQNGPEYAGGEFATVKLATGENQTFYANALKKVHATRLQKTGF